MSSNIRIIRICEYCNKEFEARKTTSKVCSDDCAKRAYKARKRAEKINASNEQVRQIKAKPIEDLKVQEFLTVDESARLARVSRRTLYRLIERDELPVTKLIRRTVIRRSDIDNIFLQAVSRANRNVESTSVSLEDCYYMKEIQEKYGISEAALNQLVRRHKIPRQYNGKYAYVPKVRIDEILNRVPSTHEYKPE